MGPRRVLAIDWSGRHKADQRRFIWLCEFEVGESRRLEPGRSRKELVEHLIELASSDPDLVVGFDFAFSTPEWYLRERNLRTARELWSLLAREALTPRMTELGLRKWMGDPEWPFWRSKRPADLTPAREFRRTELEVATTGVRPSSVFKFVGPSQVGPSSLYGWQALDALAAEGFSVWPFDGGSGPLVIEIYPRLLTGAVIKTDPHARLRYLEKLNLRTTDRTLAGADDNAFDALISAAVMSRALPALTELREDPAYTFEGRIWKPPADASASTELSATP